MRVPDANNSKQLQTRNATEDAIMKRNKLMIALLAVAAVAAGCDKEGTTSQQLDKVQDKTAEASRDMKDYTFAQKAEFAEKMRGQLAEIDQKLDQISANVEKSSDEVKNATESTWDSVKRGTRKAYDSLKEGFQQSRQWVSDKIAP